jgi:hypothetical protein
LIRVRHESLPAGLSAVVRRRPGGDTDVVVSTILSPARQRAAVRVGLRVARPTGRRAALPVPLVGLLAITWAAARGIAKGLRIHLAAVVAAASVVTAGAVVVAVVPQLHGAPGGRHPAAGATQASAPVPGHSALRPTQGAQPGAGPRPTTLPSPSAAPIVDRSAAAGSGGSEPAPGTSAPGSGALPASPAPQPSASPSGGGSGGLCLDLLGIWVCL